MAIENMVLHMRNRTLAYLVNKQAAAEDNEEETTPHEPIEIDYGECIDKDERWSLYVKDSVVSLVPQRQEQNIYSTGSPAGLRSWGERFELSATEVIEKYIERSETTLVQEELRERVDEVREIEPYKDEKVLREMYADEMSLEQIAYALDCSVDDVSKWTEHHGIYIGEFSEDYSRHGEAVGETRTTSNDRDNNYADDNEVVQLHNDGYTLGEIAEEVDQPKHVVYVQLDKLIGDETHPADR